MKRILITLLLFAPLMAQEQPASSWGKRITLGSAFTNTDSVRLSTASITDTLAAADTLYSDMLPIPGVGVDGYQRILAKVTDVTGGNASDSFKVEMRHYFEFSFHLDRRWGRNVSLPKAAEWGEWRTIFNPGTVGTVSDTSLTATDSNWHGPANGRQYRVIVLDEHEAAPATAKLADYLD